MSERKNDKIVYVRKDNRVACKLTLKEAAALDKAAQLPDTPARASSETPSEFNRECVR